MGANDTHTIKSFLEAETWDGPSIIIAYGHCIAHGMDMGQGLKHQKLAVETGYWPLFRFDPRLEEQGKNPFQLDSKAPSLPLEDFLYTESRYQSLRKSDPEQAGILLEQAKADVAARYKGYEKLADKTPSAPAGNGAAKPAAKPAAKAAEPAAS
jgi:pyruvate-ferredoxin/flavodoxin oxidoreductase